MSNPPATPTPNLGLPKPPDDADDWGEDYRAAMDILDERVGAPEPEPVVTRLLLDYGLRTDDQPIYLGKLPVGEGEDEPVCKVTALYYESGAPDARFLETDVRDNIAWVNRADPTLDGQPPW